MRHRLSYARRWRDRRWLTSKSSLSTEAVVDVLELIQIEVEHRPLVLMALCLGDLLRQTVHPQRSVGQAGEVVVIGQVVDDFLHLVPFGNVAHHAYLN